jgi:hypothetical protein
LSQDETDQKNNLLGRVHKMVKEEQIQALEQFLQQSLLGIHHLFDRDDILPILKTPNEKTDFFKVENLDKIQGLMIELAKRNSLDAKRSYLQDLDPGSYELIVRTYFQIVDSTLLSSKVTKH